jgi:hypothetical protein
VAVQTASFSIVDIVMPGAVGEFTAAKLEAIKADIAKASGASPADVTLSVSAMAYVVGSAPAAAATSATATTTAASASATTAAAAGATTAGATTAAAGRRRLLSEDYVAISARLPSAAASKLLAALQDGSVKTLGGIDVTSASAGSVFQACSSTGTVRAAGPARVPLHAN